MNSTPPLAPLFVKMLAHPSAFTSCPLEEELATRVAVARASWPHVRLDAEPFVRHLAERTERELPSVERSVDLYLACACGRGDAAAVAAFDRTFRPHVVEIIGRMKESPAFGDDVFQAMSEKLFVATNGAPAKIAEYGGRASLRGWLTTVAKRTALNLRRRKVDQRGDDGNAAEAGVVDFAGRDAPEMALLKLRFKGEFEAAIRVALARLPAKERALLLMHLVDGVTLPRLAAMHGVSRATVARRLASARDALCDETRRELRERAQLTSSEYDSIAALVRSQIEVSIVHAVRDSA